jgi:hypothetical protein
MSSRAPFILFFLQHSPSFFPVAHHERAVKVMVGKEKEGGRAISVPCRC